MPGRCWGLGGRRTGPCWGCAACGEPARHPARKMQNLPDSWGFAWTRSPPSPAPGNPTQDAVILSIPKALAPLLCPHLLPAAPCTWDPSSSSPSASCTILRPHAGSGQVVLLSVEQGQWGCKKQVSLAGEPAWFGVPQHCSGLLCPASTLLPRSPSRGSSQARSRGLRYGGTLPLSACFSGSLLGDALPQPITSSRDGAQQGLRG